MTGSANNQRRILGVDYGRKRVGLALADPLRMFAAPYGTFDPDRALAVMRSLNDSSGLETIVIGWPLSAEGAEGPATSAVRKYANRIAKAFPGVDLVQWDERYTSIEARELLHRSGVPRRRRAEKKRIDAAAAAVILQQYLDSISSSQAP